MMEDKGGHGKAMDLGQKMGAEVMAKPGKEKKWYPSLHVEGLAADNPLVKKGAGSACEAKVHFKITQIAEKGDGKFTVTLEARELTPY